MSSHKPSRPASWNRPIFRLPPRRDADWWERLTGPPPSAPDRRDRAPSAPGSTLPRPSRMWEQPGPESTLVRGETGWTAEKSPETGREMASTPSAPANVNQAVTVIGCLVFAVAAWLLFQVDIFSPTWWIALTFVTATLPFALGVLPGLTVMLVMAALVFVIAGWLLSLWVPNLQPPVSFTPDRHIVIQLPGTDPGP